MLIRNISFMMSLLVIWRSVRAERVGQEDEKVHLKGENSMAISKAKCSHRYNSMGYAMEHVHSLHN